MGATLTRPEAPRLTVREARRRLADTSRLSSSQIDELEKIVAAHLATRPVNRPCAACGSMRWSEHADAAGEPLISRDTGMIGYPSYADSMLVVTTVYNPSIQFGQNVKVVTDLASGNASGVWRVQALVHRLEAEMPHGVWQTRFTTKPPSITAPQVRSNIPWSHAPASSSSSSVPGRRPTVSL